MVLILFDEISFSANHLQFISSLLLVTAELRTETTLFWTHLYWAIKTIEDKWKSQINSPFVCFSSDLRFPFSFFSSIERKKDWKTVVWLNLLNDMLSPSFMVDRPGIANAVYILKWSSASISLENNISHHPNPIHWPNYACNAREQTTLPNQLETVNCERTIEQIMVILMSGMHRMCSMHLLEDVDWSFRHSKLSHVIQMKNRKTFERKFHFIDTRRKKCVASKHMNMREQYPIDWVRSIWDDWSNFIIINGMNINHKQSLVNAYYLKWI